MAKILISSIGNGQYNKDTGQYDYRTAKYELDGKFAEHSHIFDAMLELGDFDKFILMGTTGSNWAFLYDYVCRKPDVENANADYFFELLALNENTEKRYADTNEVEKMLNPLKVKLGSKCADILIMKYGLSNDEHMYNFRVMTRIAEHINDGDSLTFDITHGFRSLAIYELLALNYLKDLFGANIKLDFVSYGMNDASTEIGYSPIVDLSKLITMIEWQKAAEEYRRSGTAYLLADLLESGDLGIPMLSDEAKASLKKLGDTLVGNEQLDFRKLIIDCGKIVKSYNEHDTEKLIVGHIFENLSTTFGSLTEEPILLYTRLAQRHFEFNRYIACAITLTESLLDYFASIFRNSIMTKRNNSSLEKSEYDDFKAFTEKSRNKWIKETSDKFAARIQNAEPQNTIVDILLTDYDRIKTLRNQLAHGESLENRIKNSGAFYNSGIKGTIKEILSKYVVDIHEYIKYNFVGKENKENVTALGDAIFYASEVYKPRR